MVADRMVLMTVLFSETGGKYNFLGLREDYSIYLLIAGKMRT